MSNELSRLTHAPTLPHTKSVGIDIITPALSVQTRHSQSAENTAESKRLTAKAFGQLVQLGFDVTVFAPAAYQRGSLPRPSKESSSCGRLRT